MMADVQPIFSPAADAMRQHLEHLFGGYLDGCHDGLIELAWTDTRPDETGRYRLKNANYFGTDQFEELIAEATRLNSTPMCNVYVGAALRKPGTPPFGRSKDHDAYALTAVYTDLDDEGATVSAKGVYGEHAKPTMVVVTGREPHTRAQLWWRLDEPITDPAAWPDLLRGMAKAMGGDSSVCNSGRVMRLAGTVAWPVKEGRTAVELTAIVPLQRPGQAAYSAGHLATVFPPVISSAPGAINTGEIGVSRGTNSLGLLTKVEDGREKHMLKTIAALLLEYIGETGAVPDPQELFDISWPQYERGTDFTRSGRGKDEFARKCQYTIKRFERGEIRGLETVDKAVEEYAKKTARPGSGARARIAPARPARRGYQNCRLHDTGDGECRRRTRHDRAGLCRPRFVRAYSRPSEGAEIVSIARDPGGGGHWWLVSGRRVYRAAPAASILASGRNEQEIASSSRSDVQKSNIRRKAHAVPQPDHIRAVPHDP